MGRHSRLCVPVEGSLSSTDACIKEMKVSAATRTSPTPRPYVNRYFEEYYSARIHEWDSKNSRKNKLSEGIEPKRRRLPVVALLGIKVWPAAAAATVAPLVCPTCTLNLLSVMLATETEERKVFSSSVLLMVLSGRMINTYDAPPSPHTHNSQGTYLLSRS